MKETVDWALGAKIRGLCGLKCHRLEILKKDSCNIIKEINTTVKRLVVWKIIGYTSKATLFKRSQHRYRAIVYKSISLLSQQNQKNTTCVQNVEATRKIKNCLALNFNKQKKGHKEQRYFIGRGTQEYISMVILYPYCEMGADLKIHKLFHCQVV